jgi:hypothetical protein
MPGWKAYLIQWLSASPIALLGSDCKNFRQKNINKSPNYESALWPPRIWCRWAGAAEADFADLASTEPRAR